MQLNHLHLHVADIERAAAFYGRWFGLTRHAWHHGVLFLRDEAGLDLALAPGPPDVMPPWFHFGFRLPEPEAVRDLHRRLIAAAEPIAAALEDEPKFTGFRCHDPDGHLIEVYWEP